VGLVAVGSFLFHATLLFEAQLADELPMIYVASLSLWLLFDISPGFGIHNRTKLIFALLALFNVSFTWS
jgi:dihydroceramidase